MLRTHGAKESKPNLVVYSENGRYKLECNKSEDGRLITFTAVSEGMKLDYRISLSRLEWVRDAAGNKNFEAIIEVEKKIDGEYVHQSRYYNLSGKNVYVTTEDYITIINGTSNSASVYGVLSPTGIAYNSGNGDMMVSDGSYSTVSPISGTSRVGTIRNV